MWGGGNRARRSVVRVQSKMLESAAAILDESSGPRTQILQLDSPDADSSSTSFSKCRRRNRRQYRTRRPGLPAMRPQRLTVVLVGQTGNGKSATSNSLLGRDAFAARRSFASVTEGCARQVSWLDEDDALVASTSGDDAAGSVG